MSKESAALKKNVEDQLSRLLAQLDDLEELRDELEPDEVEEMRAETMEEMKEFEATLEKMMSSNEQLVDEFARHRMAIQEAIRGAFQTPDVIRMFASKSGNGLRQRLAQLDRDMKLGNVKENDYNRKRLEVLTALKKLGETLSEEEKIILASAKEGGTYTEASTDVDASSAALSGLQLKD